MPAIEKESVSDAVRKLLEKARAAQQAYERYNQAQVDEVVTAVAWVVVNPKNNPELAELAVAETGLGKVEDKIGKNRRKTMGLLRDLREAKSVGVVAEYPDRGITEIARPVGVVGAVLPATNPVATPINNAMNALKGRNAILYSPSPSGQRTCARVVELIHQELSRIGAPVELVQPLPPPAGKAMMLEMMRQVDLVVVTGSQNNVRAAYSSGTPAIGVGRGNATVIVDESADLSDAATKIARSKCYDHATSCSSDNSLVILNAIYEPMLKALEGEGGALLTPVEKQKLQQVMWMDGRLSGQIIAKPAATICQVAGLMRPELLAARFLMVEEDGFGPAYPFSGEKLSPVLTLYRARDFGAAFEITQGILEYQGKGHSCGIYTKNDEHIMRLGLEMPVCRVLVNQAHVFATGGSFDNGLPFSLSMGCGTWGRNSISNNLNYRHYLNITRISRTIPPREVTEEELFASFRAKYGI
ncbi:MAG: aldehyde dehydrogenase family protein [Acidobacteria bacterium]|nr:aldehyde dehydrogenase family protein [Acidobacteriota bacterium]